MSNSSEDVFKYTPATASQHTKYEAIRAIAADMHRVIIAEAPDSREKSLAITKLEEAVMWANKAVSRG
jgi:hypothetical protein